MDNGPDPEDTCFYRGSTLLFARPGGVFGTSRPVSLPCGRGRDINTSCLLLQGGGIPDPEWTAAKPAPMTKFPTFVVKAGSYAL